MSALRKAKEAVLVRLGQEFGRRGAGGCAYGGGGGGGGGGGLFARTGGVVPDRGDGGSVLVPLMFSRS